MVLPSKARKKSTYRKLLFLIENEVKVLELAVGSGVLSSDGWPLLFFLLPSSFVQRLASLIKTAHYSILKGFEIRMVQPRAVTNLRCLRSRLLRAGVCRVLSCRSTNSTSSEVHDGIWFLIRLLLATWGIVHRFSPHSCYIIIVLGHWCTSSRLKNGVHFVLKLSLTKRGEMTVAPLRDSLGLFSCIVFIHEDIYHKKLPWLVWRAMGRSQNFEIMVVRSVFFHNRQIMRPFTFLLSIKHSQ